MERTSFTSKIPPETKLAIIRKIPAYINKKCNISYSNLQFSDTFTVDLFDVEGQFVAELAFDDKGTKVIGKCDKKLKIDAAGLSTLWTEELNENFGFEYLDYINSTIRKDEFSL